MASKEHQPEQLAGPPRAPPHPGSQAGITAPAGGGETEQGELTEQRHSPGALSPGPASPYQPSAGPCSGLMSFGLPPPRGTLVSTVRPQQLHVGCSGAQPSSPAPSMASCGGKTGFATGWRQGMERPPPHPGVGRDCHGSVTPGLRETK